MFLKDVLSGVSDTFRNLLFAMVYSLAWWAALFLILPAPAVTIALFQLTDPRIVHADDRPNWREVVCLVGTYLWPGWRLALALGPIVLIAIWNLVSFGRQFSSLSILTPLWITVWMTGTMLGFFAASTVGLFGDSLRLALARAAAILVRRPLASTALLLILILALLGGAALVLPLVLFVPALITAVVNRFVLRSLGVAVPDAFEPTPEHAAEEQRERASRAFGP